MTNTADNILKNTVEHARTHTHTYDTYMRQRHWKQHNKTRYDTD